MFRHRLVCLAALGVVALLTAAPTRAEQPGHKFLPADAEIIATLNFRQILDSELATAHKDKIDIIKGLLDNAVQNNEEAKRYLQSLGFDLFRDFNSTTVASAASLDPDKVLVIIEGKFTPEKFHKTAVDAAKEHGEILKIVPVGEHKVIEVSIPGQPKTLYVSLANNSTLLAATAKAVITEALASGTKGSGLKKEVRNLLKTTGAKQSFSIVTTGKALGNLVEKGAEMNPDPKAKAQAQMVAPILKMIAGLSTAITVKKDIDFQIGIGTRDKEAADVLHKQASGILPLIKGMVAQKAQEDRKLETAAEVLNSLRTSVEGTTLIIRGQVTAEVLEKAFKNAQR